MNNAHQSSGPHALYLSRRQFVGMGAALPAGLGAPGCAARPRPTASTLSDAHAHFFNAADLPVANFVRYVLLPARHASMPPWGEALIDLFANLFKTLAISASAENRRSATFGAPSEVTPERFGTAVTAYILERTAGGSETAADKDGALAQSYRALNRSVAADAGHSARLVDPNAPQAGDFALVARKADAGATAPGDVAARAGAANMSIGNVADAARLVGWGYQMLQPRARHIEQYLRRFASGNRRTLVVNHLVDYDFWLNDAPSQGSDQFAQIAVMSGLASRYRGHLDLRLFAGYCPLRHALETATRQPTTLDRLLALRSEGRVHGFKLYPPMGFQASGNERLVDAAFDPRARSRRTALDRWAAVSTGPLGRALDAALEVFYAACARERIPLMAHAANSNGAGAGYGARADHAHWEAVVARHELRLSLGHLVDDVGSFVRAVDAGSPFPEWIWSLRTAPRLLDPDSGRREVYGDLGYAEELIDNPALAARFFRAVRSVYGARDPDLSRIFFGTDWIMLGIERHNDRYRDAITEGMRAAGYTLVQQQNILVDNLRRFLSA